MSNVINWEEIGKGSKTQGGGKQGDIQFLRLQSGNTYVVRPLGSPVIFHKYLVQHDGEWRSAICEDPENCPVRQKHNTEPRERYAVNVIDRADGEIKVMEGPVTVFKVFRTYFEGTANRPGGAQGADFKIVITGSGLKTRYDTQCVKRTPFTDEEKKKLQAEGLYKLDRIYKATSSEEIDSNHLL